MNKGFIIVFTLLVAAAVLVWFLPREENEDISTVVISADGVAAVEIPGSALPLGMFHEDISMAAEESAGDVLAAYEFGPDGTQFAEPVTISFTLPYSEASTLPLLAQLTDDEVIILENISYQFDEESNAVTVAAPVTHFSRYVALNGFVRVRPLQPVASKAVSARFEVPLTIAVDEQVSRVITFRDGREGILAHELSEPPQLKHTWEAGGAYEQLRSNAGEQTVSLTEEMTTLREPLICSESGVGKVSAEVGVGIAFTITYPSGQKANNGLPRTFFNNFTTSASGECIMPDKETEANLQKSESESVLDELDTANTSQAKITTLMVRLGNGLYPEEQFLIDGSVAPTPCGYSHYRLRDGRTTAYGVANTDSYTPVEFNDPNPGVCSFGRYENIERINIDLPATVLGDIRSRVEFSSL